MKLTFEDFYEGYTILIDGEYVGKVKPLGQQVILGMQQQIKELNNYKVQAYEQLEEIKSQAQKIVELKFMLKNHGIILEELKK